MRYKKWDIIEEHADPTSELYAPLMRHGEHPKRGHQVIDEHLKKYRAQFEGKFNTRYIEIVTFFYNTTGVEHISILPKWLDRFMKGKHLKNAKLPGTRLCVRETKWTTPVLKQLHEDLTGKYY